VDLINISLKITKNYEKSYINKFFFNENFINNYFFLDFLNYNNYTLDKFYHYYCYDLGINFLFYKILNLTFCNYFEQFFLDYGDYFEPGAYKNILRYFRELFMDSLFQFFPIIIAEFFFITIDFYI